MFKFYNKYVLPRLINRDMGKDDFNETRAEIVKSAYGTVLEIGFGSGYNLPFYKRVDKLYALDPSPELYQYAKDRITSVQFPVEYLQSSAEKIPLDNEFVDTVISTWTLCSIPDLKMALKEVYRVLKPGGKFLFVEHGLSSKKINSTLQKLITPISKNFTRNCHLDRKIDDFVKESNLIIETIEMLPEKGRPLMFSYRGVAVKRQP